MTNSTTHTHVSPDQIRPSETAQVARAISAAHITLPPRTLPIRNDERGAATAEYAIATMAAVGFAGLLVVIMRSDEIRGILTDLVRNALTFVG
jgi:Flp pilus assembly pilin Flp